MDVVTLALAKKYALKMNSIGIQSGTTTATGIEFLLKDGTTKVDIPIANWMSYNQTDKDKVAKLIIDGNGKMFLSNDGTYRIPMTTNTNDNKDFPIYATKWVQDTSDSSKYTYTLTHGLNCTSLTYTILNSNNEAELMGFKILDNNNIRLSSISPIDATITLNYSSSNSDRLTNTATIDSAYIFNSMADANTYFSANLNALVYGLLIAVGSPEKIYKYTGLTAPSSYDNTKWSEQTAFIRGADGIQGTAFFPQGIYEPTANWSQQCCRWCRCS
jgi:hypothetical protein